MVSSRSASVHSDLTVHVSLLFHLCLVKCSCWLKKSRVPHRPASHVCYSFFEENSEECFAGCLFREVL